MRRAQTVADHFPDPVFTVVGTGRLIDQVTAQLAHVTDGRRPVLVHVAPELAGTEFAADGETRSAADGRAPAHA